MNNDARTSLTLNTRASQLSTPPLELLAGLQKPTRSYKPVTCYQITKKGLGVVKKISRKDKEIVHEVTYMRGSRELLEAGGGVERGAKKLWSLDGSSTVFSYPFLTLL